MNKTIKRSLVRLYRIFNLFGFDPLVLFATLRGLPFYLHDYSLIKKQKGNDSKFIFGHYYPILHERNDQSGTMSGDYFHQDLLVAKKIFKNNPIKHIDIGSRTDGFVAHIAVFREIEIFDIRNQDSKVENIIFKQADLLNLPKELINYCDSISSLHAIEHFGLGRYGDPIDYYGHEKAIESIYQILKSKGKFYFSVPVGKQRIEFNALRVFDIGYLIKLLEPRFIIESFSYVNNKGDLFENIDITTMQIKSNFTCRDGCGIFELVKR